MARVAIGLLLGCLGLGCHKDEPAKTTPEPMASTTASVMVSAPASVSAAPAKPKKTEAEFYGKVSFPPGAPHKGMNVMAAVGDCAAKTPEYLSEGSVAESGTFLLEVHAPRGSDVTLCAYPEPKEGAVPGWFGKAKGSFHLDSEMELTFKDVLIELKKVP